ncbi:sodium:solute symporter family protein [Patescibacteria group bacterium]|nr:sodium:solute symporter family protein [Patescibacteria group bacterium]
MISPISIWIVGIFFAIIFVIGVWDRKKVQLEDYWVNARKTNKYILVATLVSSFVGVGALLSNAGIAYDGGGLATLLLLGSFFVYFLVYAKWFAPRIKEFGDTHNAYTLPDFLAHRYSHSVRVAGTVVNLISYALWLALQILGLGIFVAALGGMDPVWATIIGGGIVVLYTTIGGLRADIRTDIFQFIIMMVLFFVFLPMLISQGGGLQAISALPTSFLNGSGFAPWYVFVLGFLVLGATNITSADIWQRTYAGDTKKNVQWAMTVGGFVILAFVLLGALFGIYGHILLPGIDSNMVVPQLLSTYLHPIAFGVVLAGFLAAIMSSADTMLLVTSMTIVHDLIQKTFKKELTPDQTLRWSRWTTFIVGIISATIAVLVFSVVHIAIDAVSYIAVLLPAVIFGFYWKKATAPAALWSIILGTITLTVFLWISPTEAFIPAMFVSFVTFWVVNTMVMAQKKSLLKTV